MRVKRIYLQEVKLVSHELAQKYMEWGEPIPEFITRFPGALERSIEAPFQTFKGQLYKGLVEKSAILFYLMVKNHPFQNGNKRIAVVTLLYFLYKNSAWLEIDNQRLYNFARWVAESDATLKNETVLAVQKILRDNIKRK